MPSIVTGHRHRTVRPRRYVASDASAVRVVRRKMTAFGAIPPRHRKQFHKAVLDELLDEPAASSRKRRNPRGVKRKMSNFPLRRAYKRSPLTDISAAIKIVK